MGGYVPLGRCAGGDGRINRGHSGELVINVKPELGHMLCAWTVSVMRLQDLRITVRSLARTPGFTLAAVTALTLGLGASTAIFSVLDAVLLKPLPYPDAERIVVFLSGPEAGAGRGGPRVPATLFSLLKQQAAGIGDLSAYRFRAGNLTGGATPEPLAVAMVSADYFRLLGGRTSHGRTFLAEEDRSGGRNVVVLGHDFWRRRFGGGIRGWSERPSRSTAFRVW